MRELENVIERAVALEDGDVVQAESLDLGPTQADHARRHVDGLAPPRLGELVDGHPRDTLPASGFDLAQHVEQIERRFMTQALERTGGQRTKAAELLGMTFRSFRYFMKK